MATKAGSESTATNNKKNNATVITINQPHAALVSRPTSSLISDDEATQLTKSKSEELPNFLPALPSPTIQRMYQEAAAEHGGEETSNFLQGELASMAATQLTQQQQQQQQQRLRSASSTMEGVSRNPSSLGKHEKKIGHRRVDEGGEVTYKRIQSKQIMGAIQLGIQHTVGSLANKPKRDLLMNDFWEMETISFPPEGSTLTPAHHYNDFKFKVYAPIAFRYFRDLFGIAPDDFLMSMCAASLRELSNPGASGSLFYLTDDDEFIIKTVQKKEGDFLQKLLPGYYMNLSQNPRTLLPKFFGLYCFNYNTKNVRLVAMNNLLPSDIKMHAKYDLKGSTFRRKANKVERQKASPTYKDLDFMEHHPNGIFLETDKYKALINTIQRDCTVLESFQIMDYSLLVGIHNLDLAAKEKREERIRNARAKLQRNEENAPSDVAVGSINDVLQDKLQQISSYNPAAAVAAAAASVSAIGMAAASAGTGTALNRSRSINRQRLVAHSTAMESITADMGAPLEEDEDVPAGGIPARSENDERLILYIGIIDILQSYRLEKKLEHTFKSIIYNGDTVSVCRPSFYAQRFQNFMSKTVFKKTPTFPLKHSPSKRKTSMASGLANSLRNTPMLRTPTLSLSSTPMTPLQLRTAMPTGSSTPPPAFDDISEEELTATSSSYNRQGNSVTLSQRQLFTQRMSSSNRSMTGDDFSDDDIASCSSARSPISRRSPHLSKTSVQLAAIGGESNSADNPDLNKQLIVITDKSIGPQVGIIGLEQEPLGLYEHEEKGQKLVGPTSKTLAMKTLQSPTYTSTLVVNDVIR